MTPKLALIAVVVGGFWLALLCPAQPAPSAAPAEQNPPRHFTPAAPLPAATIAHSATILANGDILVVGGFGKLFGKLPVAVALARIYDHNLHTWRVTRGRLHFGRFSHAALRLPDGRVLIAGGDGQNNKPLRSLELFDPATEQFRLIASMVVPRYAPRLNLLADGAVLITGNDRQAELLIPPQSPADDFTLKTLDQLTHFRHNEHATVNLKDGSVLLITGQSTRLEKFDPHTQSFIPCQARLPKVMDDQAAALLYDGRVLIAGGQEVYTNRCVRQTWLYDPARDLLTPGPELTPTSRGTPQPGASDMQLVDLFPSDPIRQGRYLFLCGGEYDPGRDPAQNSGPDIILDSAWVYDTVNNQLLNVGPMLYPHDEFALVLLTNSSTSPLADSSTLPLPDLSASPKVLIIAGHGPGDSYETHCEIFSWNPPDFSD